MAGGPQARLRSGAGRGRHAHHRTRVSTAAAVPATIATASRPVSRRSIALFSRSSLAGSGPSTTLYVEQDEGP
jgi:hypothetical protein